jgi:hypothetical protein
MPSLVVILSAAVAALILSIKTADTGSSESNRPLIYLLLSLAFGIVGALAAFASNPNLFVGDPIFATMPLLGAIFAGVVSVLPGGIGTAVLGLFYPKPATAQTVERGRRGLVLWG